MHDTLFLIPRSSCDPSLLLLGSACQVGEMLLYFGARYEATEYLYGDEIESYHADGILTHLKKAFSRDQEEKIYAQHRIEQDPELFHDYMVTRGGYFVSCQHSSFQSGCRSADLCGVHFAVPLRAGRQHAGADGGSGCERHCPSWTRRAAGRRECQNVK